jgi:NTE family protein
VLIEPDQRDATLFFANTFSYRQRREIAEHAYQQTRRMLLDRQTELTPQLARHGVTLDLAALRDPRRRLLGASPRTGAGRNTLATRLHATLDDLQRHLKAPAAPAHSR